MCAFYGLAEATGASFTKDQRLKNCEMDANERAKLAAVAERLGREVRVFDRMTTTMSEKASVDDTKVPGDDFYEFTAEDYYRTLSSKKDGLFTTLLRNMTIELL
ncbi:plant UBX domain-containing protein 1-like [Papaver somniferum]|uniref:plant UBX domain-containing protein 1-like n=1 Tax=Papaver somniferum TaxID=3469 RepID=UPI000E6F55EB|nr:plant UBX domain-containing protein 1-like [Papaver somniferum]